MTTPFKIRCSSCKVVLTIKKKELIGKKIACPKCKAPMVVRAPTSGTPSSGERKIKKPASSQSIILEDQNDEYSDDGFANTLETSLSGTLSRSSQNSLKKGKVVKRKASKSFDDDFEDDFEDEHDDFEDDDYGDDDFEDDDFEENRLEDDYDDEFLSEDEIPATSRKSNSSGKKKSAANKTNNKYIIPASIIVGVLLLGGAAYAFLGGSSEPADSNQQTAVDSNDNQDSTEAPDAPKKSQPSDGVADNEADEQEDSQEDAVAKTESGDEDDQGAEPDGKESPVAKIKPKSGIVKKELKKTGNRITGKELSRINLGHLYQDTEAVIKIDLQGILSSSFVEKLSSESGGSGSFASAGSNKDMESITIGVKGLTKFAKASKAMGLSPAAMMMPQKHLMNLKTITVIRFNKAVDQQQFIDPTKGNNAPATSAIKSEKSEEEYEGKTIHITTMKLPGEDGEEVSHMQAICFFDELTMVTGQLEDVKYAIKNPLSNISGSSEFLKSKYQSQQFVAILAPENPEEFFINSNASEEATEDSDKSPAPSPLSFVSPETLGDLVSVSIGATFSDSVKVNANIRSGKAKTMIIAEEMIKTLVNLGTYSLNEKADSAPDQFKDIFSLGKDLLSSVEIKQNENELDVVLVFQESHIKPLAKLPGAMMGLMMGMAMPQQPAGEELTENSTEPVEPEEKTKEEVVPEKKPSAVVPVTKGGGFTFNFSKGKNRKKPRKKPATPAPAKVIDTPEKNTPPKKSSPSSKSKSSFLDSGKGDKKTKKVGSDKEYKPLKFKLSGGIFSKKGKKDDGDDGRSKKKSKGKKKSSFLSGGDSSDDTEDLSDEIQELVDAGAEIKKNEDGDVIRLKMTGSEVVDETLEKIATISTLEHLILSKTGITDAGIAHLKELSSLKVLILTQTNITDDASDDLVAISSLITLAIKKTKITKDGAEKIQGELENCKVQH